MFFFFNDTATTEIYTLSLHDALPICGRDVDDQARRVGEGGHLDRPALVDPDAVADHGLEVTELGELLDGGQAGREAPPADRSEEHTSELQSRQYLVCRLLLEKKKNVI